MTTTPPGWYDDGSGKQRWWDGERWAESSPPQPTDSGNAGVVSSVAPAGVAVAAPPGPKQSRQWVVWVVAAAALLLVALVAGASMLPALLRGSAASGGPGGVAAASEDQAAAIEAVETYDLAWQESDCDAFLASTTEGFRKRAGLPDCSEFETEAEGLAAATRDYEIEITGVSGDGGKIRVSTTESFTALLGEDGTELEEPIADSVDWTYVLVARDDAWAIDEVR